MSNLSIISSTNGFILYGPKPSEETFDPKTMQEQVEKYWGSHTNEKRFTIPFWKLESLFFRSNLHQIALKVTNIGNPELVDAEWVSFNASTSYSNTYKNSEAIKEASEKILKIIENLTNSNPETYFVLDEKLLESFIQGFKDQGVDTMINQTVTGRIGKSDDNTEVVFFMLGQNNLHLGGAGGISGSCGVKIPPKR